MTLAAIDNIDDAVEATRAFLWPFDLGRWAKLALLAFFIGGGTGVNPLQFTGGTGTTPETAGSPASIDFSGMVPSISGAELAIAVGVIGVVLAVVLALMLVGAVVEFVFVESLSRERVRIREYWGEHWRQGVRLFGFRLLVGVFSIGVPALLAVAGLSPVLFGDGELSIALLALAAVGFVVLAIGAGLANGFTTNFVVPVMIVEDHSLLAAWRRFWPTLTAEWKEYTVYVVMSFVLQIAVGILTSVVTAIAAILLLIPLGIVALIGGALLSVSSIAGWAIIGVAGVLFVLGLLTIALLVAVPVQTFLRYYALLVLGDTNGAFDVIPERRNTIRA